VAAATIYRRNVRRSIEFHENKLTCSNCKYRTNRHICTKTQSMLFQKPNSFLLRKKNGVKPPSHLCLILYTHTLRTSGKRWKWHRPEYGWRFSYRTQLFSSCDRCSYSSHGLDASSGNECTHYRVCF